MTLAEVQEIFGETGRDWRPKFQSNPGHGSTRKCWMGDGIAYLVFGKNMRLYRAEWHQDGDLSAAKRAFERVREGMTRAQVQGLFSREPDSAHESEEIWLDYDGEAYVKYAGASVTGCSWFRSRDISLELEYRDREFGRNSPLSWLVSRTCNLN